MFFKYRIMQLKLSDKQLKLVEDLGVYYEKYDLQPAAARIYSLLMVSDRNELTFEEIYENLNISKSAASNAINLMIGTQRVEYTTRPGERKRYFRCKVESLTDGMQKSMTSLLTFNNLLKEVIALRPEDTKEFNDNLREVIGFLDFMSQELPLLAKKWENRKK
mgnify:CR=1 FL=1